MAAVTNEQCEATETDPTQCIFAQVVSKYVKTPVFALQSVVDNHQVCPGCSCDNCTDQQEINQWAHRMQAALTSGFLTGPNAKVMRFPFFHDADGYLRYTTYAACVDTRRAGTDSRLVLSDVGPSVFFSIVTPHLYPVVLHFCSILPHFSFTCHRSTAGLSTLAITIAGRGRQMRPTRAWTYGSKAALQGGRLRIGVHCSQSHVFVDCRLEVTELAAVVLHLTGITERFR